MENAWRVVQNRRSTFSRPSGSEIDFGTRFGSIFAPKIDFGGPWAQKGRPSILNNAPMKIQLFDLGGCPGTPKIHPRSAFKIQCDFLLILAPKMAPLGLSFSTIFWTRGAIDIDPGDVFAGCSPQPRPKWPKASHKTSPGTPQGAPRAPQRPPGTPLGMPQGIKMRPQGFPRTPRGARGIPFCPFG